jgi:hypothetical protein
VIADLCAYRKGLRGEERGGRGGRPKREAGAVMREAKGERERGKDLPEPATAPGGGGGRGHNGLDEA